MNYLEKKIEFHGDEILTFQDQETGKIYHFSRKSPAFRHGECQGWIKERARVQEIECENQINKMKQKFFIVDGEELTTKDIDRLNHM